MNRSCRLPDGAARRASRLDRLALVTGVPVIVLELLGVASDALSRSARFIARDHVGRDAWARAMAVTGAARTAIMVAAIEATARADKAQTTEAAA